MNAKSYAKEAKREKKSWRSWGLECDIKPSHSSIIVNQHKKLLSTMRRREDEEEWKTVALGHHHPWPISNGDWVLKKRLLTNAIWRLWTSPLKCKDQKASFLMLPLLRSGSERSRIKSSRTRRRKLFINEIVTVHKWNYTVDLLGGIEFIAGRCISIISVP